MNTVTSSAGTFVGSRGLNVRRCAMRPPTSVSSTITATMSGTMSTNGAANSSVLSPPYMSARLYSSIP